MENDANQPGNSVSAEEALARLQALEQEAAALRAQISGPTAEATAVISTPGEAETPAPAPALTSEPAPSTSEQSAPLGLMAKARLEAKALPQPSEEALSKAEGLCQRFQLELKRGNKEFASKYLDEARAIAPGSSLVVECQADFAAFDRKNLEAAHLYRIAVVLDQRNKSADAKLADLVFRSQAKSAAIVAEMGETTANARIATLLSALVPGLGQIVTGSIIPGVVLMLAWLVCLVLGRGALQSITAIATQRGSVDIVSLIPLGIGFIIWLAAVLHMNGKAKHRVSWESVMNADAPKKGPVKPPVDLPFE
ncbi:MAG: hypothetical protein ABL949_01875 [Fimbriimonadaceae bacterium]